MAIGDDSRTRFLLFWDCKDWNEEGACDAFELHRGPSRAKIKTRFSRELDERMTYHAMSLLVIQDVPKVNEDSRADGSEREEPHHFTTKATC